MKATTWLLCPIVLTLFCATRLVCTAQRYTTYPLDLTNSNSLQDDYYWLDKRNKPSLSIVNPLDVLRQRLLLEIARRQMKENTRQVELNRAILKNVGKRMHSNYGLTTAKRYQLAMQQRQQDELQQQHFPSLSIYDLFDILQDEQQLQGINQQELLTGDQQVSNSIKKTPDVDNEINGSNKKAKQQQQKLTAVSAATQFKQTTNGRHNDNNIDNNSNTKKLHDIAGNNVDDDVDSGTYANVANDNVDGDDVADAYKWQYLYRLHKNHLIKK